MSELEDCSNAVHVSRDQVTALLRCIAISKVIHMFAVILPISQQQVREYFGENSNIYLYNRATFGGYQNYSYTL